MPNEIVETRDTDADWVWIGQQDPYWGVLTHPEFRRENLTAEAVEAFYATGRAGVGYLVANLQRFLGVPVEVRSALDVGCGVGRLTEAMAAYAGQATGYDIAPGMLEIARERGRARYVDEIPDETFDWINSYIVFQHIPPDRGLELMRRVLARLAPGGFVTLHVTVWKDPSLRPVRKSRRWSGPPIRTPPADPLGSIRMYDYDLNAVCEILNTNGVLTMMMMSEDHAGHHGVVIYGRREFTA